MRDARGSPAIGSGPRRVRVGRPYQTLQENENPTSFERDLATVIELLPKGTLPKGISHSHAAHLRVGAIRGIKKTCRSSKDLRKEIAQCRFDQEWRAHEIQHIRLCFGAGLVWSYWRAQLWPGHKPRRPTVFETLEWWAHHPVNLQINRDGFISGNEVSNVQTEWRKSPSGITRSR